MKKLTAYLLITTIALSMITVNPKASAPTNSYSNLFINGDFERTSRDGLPAKRGLRGDAVLKIGEHPHVTGTN